MLYARQSVRVYRGVIEAMAGQKIGYALVLVTNQSAGIGRGFL